MTRRSSIGGAAAVTSMVSALSTGTSLVFTNAAQGANAVTALSGAMTAGTLKTAYQASGKGRVNFFAVGVNDATSRTVRVRITVNGVVVFDKTSGAITFNGQAVVAIGGVSSASGNPVVLQPIDYTNGVLIEIASSVTETDKLTTAINAEVRL